MATKNKFSIDTVRWKERFPNAGVDAKAAHSAITEIKDQKGGTVAPEHIVTAAKAKNHVLHPIFEWSDTVAAKKYRLAQAGNLLRSIEVIYKETPTQPRRAFEIIEKKPSGSKTQQTLYSTPEEIAANPESHDALVAEAIRALMAWRARFKYLKELQRIVVEIDRVIDELVEA